LLSARAGQIYNSALETLYKITDQKRQIPLQKNNVILDHACICRVTRINWKPCFLEAGLFGNTFIWNQEIRLSKKYGSPRNTVSKKIVFRKSHVWREKNLRILAVGD